jgi:hypothetical protein
MRWLPCLLLLAACEYDSTNYEPEVKERAAAELHCDASQLQITGIPDNHGTHTFVVDGCGCTATYVCAWKDWDGCNREPTLESVDASCR